MNPLKVAITGIGGFGRAHVKMVSRLAADNLVQCVAFSEINITNSMESYDQLISLGARHYEDYQVMLANHPEIDFVVIATPIPFHKTMAVYAMEHGFNVLLEKPPAVTIQDIDEMIETSERSGKACAVNFQNTCGNAFQAFIEQIREERVGKLQNITGVGMWKRTDQYFERTFWSGKLVWKGQYVLDGSMNNALSHLLNNCFVAAGAGDPKQVAPKWVQAELYHGHAIEAEDTACVRIGTNQETTIHFFATLCSNSNGVPFIKVEGSRGEMIWNYDNKLFIKDTGGQEEEVSFPKEDLIHKMYLNMIQFLHRQETALYCSIADCRSFVLSANGAFESSRETISIPDEHLIRQKEGETIATQIKQLDQIFEFAIQDRKLFSELLIPWARSTEPVPMDLYKQFNLYQ